jgi:hypothetical protein
MQKRLVILSAVLAGLFGVNLGYNAITREHPRSQEVKISLDSPVIMTQVSSPGPGRLIVAASMPYTNHRRDFAGYWFSVSVRKDWASVKEHVFHEPVTIGRQHRKASIELPPTEVPAQLAPGRYKVVFSVHEDYPESHGADELPRPYSTIGVETSEAIVIN